MSNVTTLPANPPPKLSLLVEMATRYGMDHRAFDGMEFEEALTDKGELVSTTCRIYRKDRGHPIAVTEWLSECYRPTEAWKMRHRMLRHKSAMQCARYAFGFAGIYDEDEAERF